MNAPSFPFYPSDFIGSTAYMTAEEVGVYIRLLCHQWHFEFLPNDNHRLSIIAGAACHESVQTVKKKFALCPDGNLRQPRLEKIRQERVIFIEKCRKAGKRGGGNPNFIGGKRNPYYSKDKPTLTKDKGGLSFRHKGKINSPSPVREMNPNNQNGE